MKDKEYYNCYKKIHPSSHCSNNNKKKDDNNNKSKYSKKIKASIKNMYKDMKKANKTFTNIQVKISDLKEKESDLSDSDGKYHSDSFFLLKENCPGLEPKQETSGQKLLYNNNKKRYMYNVCTTRQLLHYGYILQPRINWRYKKGKVTFEDTK